MECLACFFENNEPVSYTYTPTTIDKLKVFDENTILCCSNCGFGMIEKDVDEDILKRYYLSDYSGKAKKKVQTNSETLDTRSSYSHDIRSISQLSLIKQYVNFNSKSKVIEIGAGTGDFLFSLRQINFTGNYVAFEPQEDSHKCLESLGGSVEKDIFDSNGAQKHKNSADLVIMSHSLEHFNPGKILEIVKAVELMLKHEGVFFCEVPNADIAKYPDAGERVVPHLSFFSITALSHFINKTGLSILFINACGNSQLNKHHHDEIGKLEENDSFIFELDKENNILRNKRYHTFLDLEKLRLQKKQKLLTIFYKIFGEKFILKIFNLIRKFRQKSFNSLIGHNYFSYSSDKEFIRLIAIKR